ncbi:zinc finger BED domain-containing protein RICESLEEPER 2-like [Coffea arabica]|uniref:Zinc finger BED domain-containing protein RICESLEEPER 2-like n=1 Tax=Coffea arabica TaxID=13443 RepID=A0ABM4VQA2_COFAR
MAESANPDLSGMAKTMKDKYDKYWGRVEKMNMLIFIACMLDPRTKFEYFEFIACKMYGDTEGAVVARVAKDAMYELFDEYKRFNTAAGSITISQSSTSSLSSGSENSISSFDGEKGNSLRLPILSQMARDVLVVPVSTVASESDFSTGGRVLDPFRSSLTPRIVQALISAQDWL